MYLQIYRLCTYRCTRMHTPRHTDTRTWHFAFSTAHIGWVCRLPPGGNRNLRFHPTSSARQRMTAVRPKNVMLPCVWWYLVAKGSRGLCCQCIHVYYCNIHVYYIISLWIQTLRRYLTLQIIVNYTPVPLPEKVPGSIGLYYIYIHNLTGHIHTELDWNVVMFMFQWRCTFQWSPSLFTSPSLP